MDGGPIGFDLAWHEARGGNDWDGDDALDLAVANFGASRVDILENQL